MVNQKSAVLIISSCLLFYTVYFHFYDNYALKINAVDVKKIKRREPIYFYGGNEEFLINTTGCFIPNYGKNLVFKESKNYYGNCGERAIFIEKIESDQIVFKIDDDKIKKHSKNKNTYCYYNFASRSNIAGKEDTRLSYTEWKPFKNGTKIALKEEVVTVICDTTPKSNVRKSLTSIYEDSYVFVKRLTTLNKKTSKEKSWNVLILGMDTMSRARVLSTMPETVQYLHRHGWLDYRGYQKVGYNTFPNLMAILTGRKLSTVYKKCASGMSKCNDIIIWSRFSKAGYVTAYGEDYLRLPDTFFRNKGFQTLPTHHYLRPFFLTGETQRGNLVCAKHKTSVQNVLDYIYEFANAYQNETYFGTFWLNSYSHNVHNLPTLLDKDMVNFLEQLNKSDVLNNTIIVFLSDHGIRYGEMRLPVESYYEERLPMFFVWIPHEFRKIHKEKYYNLQLNQNRLVTPYDLYVTLTEISNALKKSDVESEACPQCTSLFEEKSVYRTCEDAGVSEKWCSCHNMTEVDPKETGANTSLQLAVQYVQNKTKSIETIGCKECYSLQMTKVLRSHSYKGNDNKTRYVVAWQMIPGYVSYEATVVQEDNEYTILQPTHTITAYNVRGNCVKNPNDRPYCVCKSVKCKRGITHINKTHLSS